MRTPIHCLEEADKKSIRIIDITKTINGIPFYAQVTYTRQYTHAYHVHPFDLEEYNHWVEKGFSELKKPMEQGSPFDELDEIILSKLKENFAVSKIIVIDTFFDCDIDEYKYLAKGQQDAIEFVYRPLSIEQKYDGVTNEHFCVITLDIYCLDINEIKIFGVKDMFAYYQFPEENKKVMDVRVQYKYKESTITYLKAMMKKYFNEEI